MSTRRLVEVDYSRDEGVVIHVRPRAMRLVPREGMQHLRNANRECLLAMRTLLDAVIERTAPSEEKEKQGPRRRRIEVKEETA